MREWQKYFPFSKKSVFCFKKNGKKSIFLAFLRISLHNFSAIAWMKKYLTNFILSQWFSDEKRSKLRKIGILIFGQNIRQNEGRSCNWQLWFLCWLNHILDWLWHPSMIWVTTQSILIYFGSTFEFLEVPKNKNANFRTKGNFSSETWIDFLRVKDKIHRF